MRGRSVDDIYTETDLLAMTRDGLRDIGYHNDLLRENYSFADILDESAPTRQIRIAAFAQEPLSYRSVCFGVTVLHQQEAAAIRPYRALGAPQIFALYPNQGQVLRWRIPAHDQPTVIESIDPAHLRAVFQSHKDEWNPERVLRAKAIGFTRGPVQLDFFDIGLLPALEEVVYQKLDRLLRDVIATSKMLYAEHHGRDLEAVGDEALFRLIFRFIAAKMLADRQFPGDDWEAGDPQRVIAAVERFYFRQSPREEVLQDATVQRAAWDKIRKAFLFRNLSVEALAYVYENTLVTDQSRRALDTHATPPQIAEYMVQRLPFEDLAQEERRVFEPFAGHAPFLIAALGRLRTLLPLTLTPGERHAYFVQMLTGMEIDSFAREVARYSLILADYPNPDGWDIASANAFTSPEFDTYLEQARVVLCNPPYSDFSPADRRAHPSIQSPNKAVEALQRVLRRPPRMLGFVLPRVFVDGQIYREVRRQIAAAYSNIESIVLPDTVFQHSDIETVLLIAHEARDNTIRRGATFVSKDGYQHFIQTGKPSWHVDIPVSTAQDDTDPVIWQTPLQQVWRALSYLPMLGTTVEIHRGIEYNLSLKTHAAQLVADHPRPGFVTGLLNVQEDFEPYNINAVSYLNADPAVMLYEAYKLPWDQPKILVNAARRSRGPWTITAAIDERGLVATQSFHGIWSMNDIQLEILAAVLNSPVANAFVRTHAATSGRHNQVRVLRQIPLPSFTATQRQTVISLVEQYRAYRAQWREQPTRMVEFERTCRDIIEQIDAVVLEAYDLSPRLEKQLLDYFAGHPRPGPVNFDRYYPVGFQPAIPWRIYISEGFRASSARHTLERLPVLRDPIISAMVQVLDGDGSDEGAE
jgi:hypothetical protein